MNEKENLKKWIKRRILEEQTKIDTLSDDPKLQHLIQYLESLKEILRLGQMMKNFCSPPKPEPDIEEFLYD